MTFLSAIRLAVAPIGASALLAGCGFSSSNAASSTPPSTTTKPPVTVTVTHSVPVTKTVTITQSPAATGHDALNPKASTNVSTPVPLIIKGMTNATTGSTISVGYNATTHYQWGLFSLTLWVFGNPAGSYTMPYWSTNANGTYAFQLPMALNTMTVRIIAQFLGPQGKIVTEYGPMFTVR
ncbi:hypothetical protein [Sulfobacillus harzensis]|uniref:Uncharacterized protein n=1 Tax=Sulfobacillus harzensis TaxID=2729629 RepID=A0A7Y0Q458_9FIRM|nr:hypothetical protein [Sulfobacillus harzensis]NMP24993.1 hypothetical protein [Sulfobacillus harzensis]